LKNPKTPYFTGNDLWLQRTAIFVCFNYCGIEFVAYHFKPIRYGLQAYAVLRGNINYDNLNRLTELIASFGQDGIVCNSADDLLEMVER